LMISHQVVFLFYANQTDRHLPGANLNSPAMNRFSELFTRSEAVQI
jgi:hypothetical protein